MLPKMCSSKSKFWIYDSNFVHEKVFDTEFKLASTRFNDKTIQLLNNKHTK